MGDWQQQPDTYLDPVIDEDLREVVMLLKEKVEKQEDDIKSLQRTMNRIRYGLMEIIG